MQGTVVLHSYLIFYKHDILDTNYSVMVELYAKCTVFNSASKAGKSLLKHGREIEIEECENVHQGRVCQSIAYHSTFGVDLDVIVIE